MPSLPAVTRSAVSLIALAACSSGGAGCAESCQAPPPLVQLRPAVTSSTDAVVFGEVFVGGEARRGLTLRSTGTAPLAIDSIAVVGDAFALEEGTRRIVDVGGEITLEILFRPTAAGAQAGSAVVAHDAGPALVVALSGAGVEPPDCDDDNPCTDDRFAPETERCAYEPRAGPCDDGDACTVDTVCVGGACVGVTRVCADLNECLQGGCLSDQGCVAVEQLDACDDEDPCTVESCDAMAGCLSAPLPNGTPCAPIVGCASLSLCLNGSCTVYPAPDGVPCDDGDFCTVADACREGSCRGDWIEQEPEIVGTAWTFGTGEAVELSSGRLVFVDSEPVTARGVVTTVATSTMGFAVSARTEIAGGVHRLPVVVDADTVVTFVEGAGSAGEGQGLQVFTVGADDVVTPRAFLPLPSAMLYGAVGDGSIWYGARTPPDAPTNVTVVDVSDPDAPVLVNETATTNGALMVAILPAEARLLVSHATGVEAYSLADPRVPTFQSEIAPTWGLVAADAGYYARSDNGVPLPPPSIFRGSDDALLYTFPDEGRYERLAAGAGFIVASRTLFLGGTDLVRVDLATLGGPLEPVVEVATVPVAEELIVERVTRDVVFVRTSRGNRFALANDFSAPTLPFLTSPEHGPAGELTVVGDDALLVDSWDLRRLFVTGGLGPSFAGGGRSRFFSSIFALGPGATPPLRAVADPDLEAGLDSRLSFTLIDATNVDFPVPSTSLVLESGGSGRGRVVATAGHRLFALGERHPLECPSGDCPDMDSDPYFWLHTYELDAAPSGPETSLAPLASFQVPWPWSGGPSVIGLQQIHLDVGAAGQVGAGEGQGGERLAMTATVGGGFGTPSRYWITLLDVDDSSAPIELGSVEAALPTVDVRVAGDRLAVLGSFGFEIELRVYDVSGDGGLTATQGVEVAGSRILLFDGSTLVLGGGSELLHYDATVDPPTQTSALALAQSPTSAAVVGGALVVTGPGSVSVVTPPCPPP